jgi:hypothetical protein
MFLGELAAHAARLRKAWADRAKLGREIAERCRRDVLQREARERTKREKAEKMRLQALKEHDTEVSLSLFLSFSLSLFLSFSLSFFLSFFLSLFLSVRMHFAKWLQRGLSVRMHFAKWLQRGPPVLNRRVYGEGILQASCGAQEREAHERDHADRRLPPKAWEPGPHAPPHSAGGPL